MAGSLTPVATTLVQMHRSTDQRTGGRMPACSGHSSLRLQETVALHCGYRSLQQNVTCSKSLETIVQVHLPPHKTRTVVVHATRCVCNVPTRCQQQVIHDAPASFPRCHMLA
jgi:hypothetical protein